MDTMRCWYWERLFDLAVWLPWLGRTTRRVDHPCR